MHNSFSLGKIKNIEIKIHFSWFLIFFLVIWSLADFYFPAKYPGWTDLSYWLASALAACFLFISVLFHELCHSLVGQKNGVAVKSITLFVFGGVAEMADEPKKPLDEFKMAIAGPISSLFLAAIFWLISGLRINLAGAAVAHYLFLINGILAVFNLIPAFPLDGGRVFRAILWAKSRNLNLATQRAVIVSRICAALLMIWGVKMLLENNLVGGFWMIFLSWFLLQAAGSSLKQRRIEDVLEHFKAREIMDVNFEKVSPQMFLADLADNFLDHKQGGFPVEENGKLAGIVTLEDLRSTSREKWATLRVRDVMTDAAKLVTIQPTDTAYAAFLKMTASDVGRLPVVENGKVVGLITRNSIIVLLAVKCEKCI